MNNLRNLISGLESFVASNLSSGSSNLFIEVRKNETETVIAGNRDGLVEIALQLLRLAESESFGDHYHIDECSIADMAETKVVLSYKQEPWA